MTTTTTTHRSGPGYPQRELIRVVVAAYPLFPCLVVLAVVTEVSVPDNVTVHVQREPELVRTMSTYERIYLFPHLVVIAERLTTTTFFAQQRRPPIPPHDDFVLSRMEDSPNKKKKKQSTRRGKHQHKKKRGETSGLSRRVASRTSLPSERPRRRRGFPPRN